MPIKFISKAKNAMKCWQAVNFSAAMLLVVILAVVFLSKPLFAENESGKIPAIEDSSKNIMPGSISIRKFTDDGGPFVNPGASISIRKLENLSSNYRFVSRDYGPSFGATQADATITLPSGLYEIGVQVPDGLSVDVSGCMDCEKKIIEFPPRSDGSKQNRILVKIIPNQNKILTFIYKQTKLFSDASLDTSETLHCNIAGVPNQMLPTDTLLFKGSDAWVKVGINRTIGDVIVALDLINPQDPNFPVNLIDSRSAGGAAWQISMGGTNAVSGKIIHFNQAAGNSARVWGYEAPLGYSPNGFTQLTWLPLYSNDYRPLGANPKLSENTSPCYNTGVRFGDGRFALESQQIFLNDKSHITRLLYRYSVRHKFQTDWKRFQFDYGIYFMPENRDLRIYIPEDDHIFGPIYPYQDLSKTPRGEVRNVVCQEEDCMVATKPISYVVMVWKIHGKDIAVAIHTVDKSKKFDGFVRFRPHVTCDDGKKCGGVQWHSEVVDSQLHPEQKASFGPGEITSYQLDYDIGTPSQLAQLGFLIK
ncbi:hypothetical protein ACELLULO517_27930 [Acidisoma cellulosilytica]|uniref:Uncharacterized protein n=1 Tax=Acidisoma cellulosilyticum TaxID=2802395 RepID=A0A963Z758_9PROT|nr:hypothetical protein [Acidisoma cellulosilyticum]MCB8884080.1 hypothetical protein [Acidisoma cellulosilyticum]